MGFQRGWYPLHIFEEIYQAGGGLRKFWTSWDTFFLKTFAYTTARVSCFLYFYDWINPDPRRLARPDYFVAAGIAGGLVAGIATNPFEVVFTRMQADEMYPLVARRNYANFFDGLYKVMEEGALMRGAVANGAKLAALCASMTSIFDLCKENSYYFLGPSWVNRFWSTAIAVTIGTAVSMPFDNIKTRLQIMRPLPNGQMPYTGTLDCLAKIIRYECQLEKSSNVQSIFAGLTPYWIRLFAICYVSQFILDYYHGANYVSEFWQPARSYFPTGIDYDFHDPYTDAYNIAMVSSIHGPGAIPGTTPSNNNDFNIV
mmetsp:Transcript_24000/g.18325  ORF Transcript_24000/g.18325 Transcript_24000/m.18325 type:complete len:314 (-) Transcript_24000:41-982(-)